MQFAQSSNYTYKCYRCIEKNIDNSMANKENFPQDIKTGIPVIKPGEK